MKAGLYLRVSSPGQVEKFSLPAQRRILTEHCERQGWQYEVYEDAGISGETLDARPGMLRLLADARAGRIGVALAVELERFSRSQDLFDWLVVRRTFREASIRWGTPAQLFSPDDPEDAFLSVLFGALASREKTKFLLRARRGKDESARQGRFVASVRPYGYTIDERRRLVVKDDEAEVVRRIFASNREGVGVRAIARTLTREHIPTPRQAFGHPLAGSGWSKATVSRVLANRLYVGQASWGRRRKVAGKLERRPEAEWITIPAPRLVSDEDFALTQKRIRANARMMARNRTHEYLLTALLTCERCGKPLHGSGSHGRRYYRPTCEHAENARADRIEAAVWAELVRGMQHPSLILAEAKRQREAKFSEGDATALRLDAVRAALQKIPGELERISLQHQEGYLPWPQAKARFNDSRRRQAELEAEAAQLEVSFETATAGREQEAGLRALLQRFGRRLANLSTAEKSAVVHGFLQRVSVGRDGLLIDSYLPNPRQISGSETASTSSNTSRRNSSHGSRSCIQKPIRVPTTTGTNVAAA